MEIEVGAWKKTSCYVALWLEREKVVGDRETIGLIYTNGGVDVVLEANRGLNNTTGNATADP